MHESDSQTLDSGNGPAVTAGADSNSNVEEETAIVTVAAIDPVAEAAKGMVVAVDSVAESEAALDSSVPAKENVVSEELVEVVEETVEEPTEKNSLPEFITVHTTAMITDSPDEVISAEYADSLQKFIYSEDHMRRNIATYELEHSATRKMRNNL